MSLCFKTELLINKEKLYQELKLKLGFLILEEYPYQIILQTSKKNIEYFSIFILSNLFTKEINDVDILSYNKLSNYMYQSDYNNTSIFLHNINSNVKDQLKQELISDKEKNRYIIYDLIGDEHYILPQDILKKYNIFISYLNGNYILLTKYNKVHNYLLSLEAKDLLKNI